MHWDKVSIDECGGIKSKGKKAFQRTAPITGIEPAAFALGGRRATIAPNGLVDVHVYVDIVSIPRCE